MSMEQKEVNLFLLGMDFSESLQMIEISVYFKIFLN